MIDHRVNAAAFWIHYDYRAGMISQRGDRGVADFHVLAGGAVPGNVALYFVTHPFIDCSLTRDCGLARSFSPTASFFEFAPVLRLELAHFRGALALAQLVAKPVLELRHIGRLLASRSRALSSHLAF